MPQIAQIAATYASQIFWLLLVFGVIYFGIGRAMLPKIEATMDARDKRIADDLAAAERARARADEAEAAYRSGLEAARAEAQRATAAAEARAAAATAERTAAADAVLAEQAAAADQRIRAAVDAAGAGIETAAAEAARDIVSRLTGTSIDAGEADRAVRGQLARA